MKLNGQTHTAAKTATYSPAGALACTTLYLIAAVLLKGSAALMLASAIVLAGQAAYLRRIEPAAFLLKITLPLAVPLFLIHGILNPQFSASRVLWEHVSLRFDGFTFAMVISARLLLVAASMSIWRYTSGTQVIGFFNHVGFPPLMITEVSVAIASIELVQRKAHAVYLAQQARGIRLRGNPVKRALNLPRLVIPVAVATIVEGSERGVVIESRGLGSGPWQLASWYSPPGLKRLLAETVSAIVVFAALAVR